MVDNLFFFWEEEKGVHFVHMISIWENYGVLAGWLCSCMLQV